MKKYRIKFQPKSHCDFPSPWFSEVVFARDEAELDAKLRKIILDHKAEDWRVEEVD